MFMMFICSFQFKSLNGDHSFTMLPKSIHLQDNTFVISVLDTLQTHNIHYTA